MNIRTRLTKLEGSIGLRDEIDHQDMQRQLMVAIMAAPTLRTRLQSVLDGLYSDDSEAGSWEEVDGTRRYVSILDRVIDADSRVRTELYDIYRLARQDINV